MKLLNNLDNYLISAPVDFPKEKTLPQLFFEQVEKASNNLAIRYNNITLTYNVLNKLSNQLSRFIKNYCFSFNNHSSLTQPLIGILMDNSADVLVAIFAILKSGAAYVPIDPQYPQERIRFIIEDAGIEHVLTNKQTLLNNKIENNNMGANFIAVDSEADVISTFPSENVELCINPSNLAYVIYTSGSTGKPKGVLVEHRNVINYAYWVKNYLNINNNDKFDCSSSFSFDLTVTVSIIPLLFGASSIVCDLAVKKNPQEYLNYLQNNQITIIKTTPSHFNMLCTMLGNDNKLANLRAIILGGEKVSLHHVGEWFNKYPAHMIINEYGPTETTVGVSCAIINQDNIKGMTKVSIGMPGHNVNFYILDGELKPVPIGKSGELYVGGASLARGYLNRAELTNERFINNPFGFGKLYKTGDLVCLHADGILEYINRNDEQVKIRGYRIELSEIENVLVQCEGIDQVAVIVHENNFQNNIVAYFVTNNKELIINDIKAHLNKFLPNYMIPTFFIELQALPLTVNGKLDKTKLPKPAMKNMSLLGSQQSNDLENKIASILSTFLGLENIDVNANFFDMGADSLSIIRFHHELINTGHDVDLMELFRYTTVRDLAKKLKAPKNISIENIPRMRIQNFNCYVRNRINAKQIASANYL